jgi:hypothetical protein
MNFRMALSNLAISLQRKYKAWRGEKDEIEREIAKIKAAYETLDEKRDRIDRVTVLLDSVETIMSEIMPDWDPAAQKGSRAHTYRHAFPIGEITRLTMDKLRISSHPLRIRDIVDHVVEAKALDVTDKDLMDAIYKSIDGNLRSMRKRGRIASTDDFAARWYIVGREDQTPSP